MLKLDYAPPPPDLAEYISAFYLFESDDGVLDDIERADIAQFRVILEGEAALIFPDGRTVPFHDVSLFGPRLCATRVTAQSKGIMRLFGCGLLPAGWAMTVSTPAHECANKILPARDLMQGNMDALRQRLCAASSFEDMVALCVESSRAFYAEKSAAPLWFIRTVNDWLGAGLVPDIADLETATGLSRRQIERQCKQYFGAPPKFLARKYRALRSANAIANGQGDWQDFIDEAYYDQPHFIREIKEFTGMTPGAIRNATSPISSLTFARAKLAGEVMPLVSAT